MLGLLSEQKTGNTWPTVSFNSFCTCAGRFSNYPCKTTLRIPRLPFCCTYLKSHTYLMLSGNFLTIWYLQTNSNHTTILIYLTLFTIHDSCICGKDGPYSVGQSPWEATTSWANQTSCWFQFIITVTENFSTLFSIYRCIPIQK